MANAGVACSAVAARSGLVLAGESDNAGVRTLRGVDADGFLDDHRRSAIAAGAAQPARVALGGSAGVVRRAPQRGVLSVLRLGALGRRVRHRRRMQRRRVRLLPGISFRSDATFWRLRWPVRTRSPTWRSTTPKAGRTGCTRPSCDRRQRPGRQIRVGGCARSRATTGFARTGRAPGGGDRPAGPLPTPHSEIQLNLGAAGLPRPAAGTRQIRHDHQAPPTRRACLDPGQVVVAGIRREPLRQDEAFEKVCPAEVLKPVIAPTHDLTEAEHIAPQ
jgi:hypothetical protein